MHTQTNRTISKKHWIAFALIAIAGVIAFFALAPTTKASANNFWDVAKENNTQNIDHKSWQQLLDRYLVSDHPSKVNRFDYESVNDEDKALLNNYLTKLQSINPRDHNRDVQMAYWINLYNALTVQTILEEYPVESITTISEDFVAFGPWDDYAATIEGQELTLNDIEHRILRPLWNDSRIHYAINCASIGCPNLSDKAFTADNLESQLESAASAYVNHERGVRFEDGELIVSSIYHWYKEDFGNSDETLVEHLKQYANPELKAELTAYEGGIDHEYDWNLNEL